MASCNDTNAAADGIEQFTEPAKRVGNGIGKKVAKRKNNPFIKAAKDDDGHSGDENDDYSDLEDFLVCKPGRDYSKMFLKQRKRKERRESI